LLELFRQAKTFGSLLSIPDGIAKQLPIVAERIQEQLQSGNVWEHPAAEKLLPFVRQAMLLAGKYDCVIANPPFMSGKGMNAAIKDFAKQQFPDSKSDLFAMFIVRGFALAKASGFLGLMTPFSWMFISSFEKLRKTILSEATIINLVKPSYTSFFESAIVSITAFVLRNSFSNIPGDFFDLGYLGSADSQPIKFKEAIHKLNSPMRFQASSCDFKRIPGSPIAYWVSDKMREIFSIGMPLGSIAIPRQGMATTNNSLFLRLWFEVENKKIGFRMSSEEEAEQSKLKWFPYNKGGEYRRWFGNNSYVVNYEYRGRTICNYIDNSPGVKVGSNGRIINREFYFRPGITWSFVSSSYFGVRRSEQGFIFDVGGSSAFPDSNLINIVTGFLGSKLAVGFMAALNPTVNYQVGNVATLPFLNDEISKRKNIIDNIVEAAVSIARTDWDSFETSWDFQTFPLLEASLRHIKVEQSFLHWQAKCQSNIHRMQELESANNRLFIEAYGLQEEFTPEVPEDQITLTHADREADIKRLLSYAIGCLMGRYSLDEPGLIYAGSGGVGFDHSRYNTFSVDSDGIVPMMEADWFDDDAANRFAEFIEVAWPTEQLEENLRFIAESLAPNRNEQPRDTIRRYFATGFIKDHLRIYKKRPIYWHFSSGKNRAFQCLVYLHRYNESTLSRMRTEYVIPLQGKISSRLQQFEDEKAKATSTSHRRKIEKEQETLRKQQIELRAFDEKLRHYADLRISLDLDDGVKVNYGKFGDLLAEVKTVTGGSEE
jgi:hypothetical protein